MSDELYDRREQTLVKHFILRHYLEKATLQHVLRLRRAVLHLMKGQFGTVPMRMRRRLEEIDAIEPLAKMIERVPKTRSAEELLAED